MALLKAEAKRLKNLPKDFRDCDPCSDEWMDFRRVSHAKAQEMSAWLRGPVLVIGSPPNKHEIAILGESRLVTHLPLITRESFCSLERLYKFLEYAEMKGYSHIYITRPFPKKLAKALNVILSLTGSKVRCLTEFEDRKGERLR